MLITFKNKHKQNKTFSFPPWLTHLLCRALAVSHRPARVVSSPPIALPAALPSFSRALPGDSILSPTHPASVKTIFVPFGSFFLHHTTTCSISSVASSICWWIRMSKPFRYRAHCAVPRTALLGFPVLRLLGGQKLPLQPISRHGRSWQRRGLDTSLLVLGRAWLHSLLSQLVLQSWLRETSPQL